MSDRPLRILYLTRGYATHDHRFLAALAGAGHHVWYLPLGGDQGPRDERPLPEQVRRVPPALSPVTPARLRAIADGVRPDVIHAGPVGDVAHLAAQAGLRPLVTVSWALDLQSGTRDPAGTERARWTLTFTDVLVCDSPAVARIAQGLGMAPETIVTFPWGVDLDHFHAGPMSTTLRAGLGWGEGFVMFTARTLEPVYGVDVALEAFIGAAMVEPDLRLLVAGDGSLRESLERRVREARMEDRVHFAGHLGYQALPEYHRSADVYLSASHSDGSSVSLLEALASGRPALVSDIPGNREWVEPRVTGWLFPPGDPQALAEAMRAARRTSQAALARMGAAARRVAEQRADWSQNFLELLRAYRLALGVNPRTTAPASSAGPPTD